jgi:acetyl esterase/lipase
VLGAYVTTIPWVSVLGSLALSLWPAWLIVFAAAGGATAYLARGNVRRTMIGLAAVTGLGATIITYQLISLAHAKDVHLSVGSPFGFSASPGGSFIKATPDEVIPYTRDQGDVLKILMYRPKRATSQLSPVLMYVHGGGWTAGTAGDAGGDLRWYADRGWLVVAVEYSLSTHKRHLWNRVIEQIGCALAWTNKNIGSRGGDEERIAMIGESAGGNLVLNAAYMANAGTLRSSCGGSVPHVEVVSSIFPGVDLTAIYNNKYVPNGPDVHDAVRQYIGGSPQQFPDRFTATASATHITPSAPPTLLFISEHDHLVPAESMRAFAKQASSAGVAIETVNVPFGEHGFNITGVGNAVVRQLSERFFNRHYRNAPPRKTTLAIEPSSQPHLK